MATLDGKAAGEDRIKELGEGVDIPTFKQILEMDDSEDDREFSKSIFFGFFDQAEDTFQKMDEALMGDMCEKIQRYGKLETEEGLKEPDEELCLSRIKETLLIVKNEYQDVEKSLKHFFGDV
ncbi:Multistep phosphorelay regulator 1 [Escovopsis weberi]|uniref:Multistep phosphorelay regulator 1 n=1 Tax=Escovopsis weberi TaxID=150374 RepID=A0A0M9VU15_ESCWE|nr:Multistep phosphorelay regulator 1 [Escovopsis weberi]